MSGPSRKAGGPGDRAKGSRNDNPQVDRVSFVSLGCPKNLVDSEKMLGTLALDGYTLVSEPEGADFVIVNTCGFIEQSRAESKAVIREMLDLKKAGKTHGVIVAGCLPERVGPALLDEIRRAASLRPRPWMAVGLSILATLFSTISYLAVPGESVKNGIAVSLGYLALPLNMAVISLPAEPLTTFFSCSRAFM